jgi:hypothetical protein
MDKIVRNGEKTKQMKDLLVSFGTEFSGDHNGKLYMYKYAIAHWVELCQVLKCYHPNVWECGCVLSQNMHTSGTTNFGTQACPFEKFENHLSKS